MGQRMIFCESCHAVPVPREGDDDFVPLELRFNLASADESPIIVNLAPIVVRNMKGIGHDSFQVMVTSFKQFKWPSAWY